MESHRRSQIAGMGLAAALAAPLLALAQLPRPSIKGAEGWEISGFSSSKAVRLTDGTAFYLHGKRVVGTWAARGMTLQGADFYVKLIHDGPALVPIEATLKGNAKATLSGNGTISRASGGEVDYTVVYDARHQFDLHGGVHFDSAGAASKNPATGGGVATTGSLPAASGSFTNGVKFKLVGSAFSADGQEGRVIVEKTEPARRTTKSAPSETAPKPGDDDGAATVEGTADRMEFDLRGGAPWIKLVGHVALKGASSTMAEGTCDEATITLDPTGAVVQVEMNGDPGVTRIQGSELKRGGAKAGKP